MAVDARVAAGNVVEKARADLSYSPPISAFQELIGKIRTGVRDLNLMVVSDSTAAEGNTVVAN